VVTAPTVNLRFSRLGVGVGDFSGGIRIGGCSRGMASIYVLMLTLRTAFRASIILTFVSFATLMSVSAPEIRRSVDLLALDHLLKDPRTASSMSPAMERAVIIEILAKLSRETPSSPGDF
jgi:hypothetical protein